MDISNLLKDPSKLDDVFEEAIRNRDTELAHVLAPFVRFTPLLLQYASEIVRGKVSDELEEVIVKDPWLSYKYARDILKGPFPKGEDTMAQDPECSYLYAKDVIKGPFPKGEDTIAKNPWNSYNYALNILKGPFPKREDTIAQDSEYSYLYAKNIIKDLWPKGKKL
ncbi:MAG: hypothetical protein QXD25_01275 [Nanopusillaceae archaeon]